MLFGSSVSRGLGTSTVVKGIVSLLMPVTCSCKQRTPRKLGCTGHIVVSSSKGPAVLTASPVHPSCHLLQVSDALVRPEDWRGVVLWPGRQVIVVERRQAWLCEDALWLVCLAIHYHRLWLDRYASGAGEGWRLHHSSDQAKSSYALLAAAQRSAQPSAGRAEALGSCGSSRDPGSPKGPLHCKQSRPQSTGPRPATVKPYELCGCAALCR